MVYKKIYHIFSMYSIIEKHIFEIYYKLYFLYIRKHTPYIHIYVLTQESMYLKSILYETYICLNMCKRLYKVFLFFFPILYFRFGCYFDVEMFHLSRRLLHFAGSLASFDVISETRVMLSDEGGLYPLPLNIYNYIEVRILGLKR